MAEKSIIIIGAGLAGLSAGCYAQMNGYKTQIFEMHNIPGGLCTSWKRKGYTFDGCIHYLMGSRCGITHRFYEELGAVQGRRMVDNDELLRVEGSGGKVWTVYTDLDRLEQHMKELSPADAGVIEAVVEQIQIPHAAADALLRVKAIGNPHLFGRITGQLHEAPYAGVTSGVGNKVGLLVNNGCDQLPVQSVF